MKPFVDPNWWWLEWTLVEEQKDKACLLFFYRYSSLFCVGINFIDIYNGFYKKFC